MEKMQINRQIKQRNLEDSRSTKINPREMGILKKEKRYGDVLKN